MRHLLILLLLASLPACTSAGREGPSLGRLGVVPPPVVVSPGELREHLGELVTLQASTGEGTAQEGRIVFPVTAAGGSPVRIVVVPPLLLAPQAAAFAEEFSHKEVWAIGRVTDLGGPLELLMGDPRRLQLVTHDEEEGG